MTATYTYKELEKIARELFIDVDSLKICDLVHPLMHRGM